MITTIARRLEENPTHLTAREVLHSIYGLGKFNFRDDNGRSLGILSGVARRRIWEYQLDDCAQILASLARAKVRNPGLTSKVVDRVDVASVKGSSSLSLVNLMTGLARSGFRNSRTDRVWDVLADEVASRLVEGRESQLKLPDMLNSVTAYSFPNLKRPHKALFDAVSERLQATSSMTAQEISKYIKACARVQYRSAETLSHCACILRRDGLLRDLGKDELLEIHSGLNKLGADMVEIRESLKDRGIHVPDPPVSGSWFRLGTPPVRITQTRRKKLKPLRRRKLSW